MGSEKWDLFTRTAVLLVQLEPMVSHHLEGRQILERTKLEPVQCGPCQTPIHRLCMTTINLRAGAPKNRGVEREAGSQAAF